MLTPSNLFLPFRFYDPNFICTFYHPILATRSVRLAPTPVLDQSSPFIQQCRLRSQVQTLHDLQNRLTSVRTTTIIQSASIATVECNAHAYVPCVWSPLRNPHFQQGRPTKWSSKRHSVVNLRASVLYLEPSTRRVTVLELVRTLVKKQRNQTENFGNWICFYPRVESWRGTNRKGLFTGSMERCPVPAAPSVSARQEITRILWKPEVHYNAHNSPPLVPVLSQINPVHALPSCSFSIYSNNILPLTDSCAKLSPNNSQNCSSVYVHLYTNLGQLYWAILSTCQLHCCSTYSATYINTSNHECH